MRSIKSFRSARFPVVVGFLGCVVCICSGCVTVQPWERGTLADPMMIFDENPIEKGIKEHALDYREGSVGGTGAQGGGCGCG